MSEFLDDLGREIKFGVATLSEIKDLIGSLKVGKAVKVQHKKEDEEEVRSNKIISRIRDLFEEYTKDFEKDAQEQINYLGQIKDVIEEKNKLKQENKDAPKKIKIPKEGKISQPEKAMAKAFAKKTLQVHDSVVNQSILSLVEAVKNCCESKEVKQNVRKKKSATEAVEDATTTATKKNDHKPKDYDFDPEDHTVYQKIHNRTRLIEHVTDKFERFGKAILGFDPWFEMTKEIPNEVKFTQDVRAAAFEVKGITKETRDLQKIFEDIGNNERLTGVERTKFQESYLRLMKGGIRDQKALKSVATAQLNTEKQLGLEAGSLQDTFQQWHLSSRLTALQIEAMGRGLRDVSRYTGLSGEAMKGVVESSKQLITSLKNAGNLNTYTNENFTRIMASAKGMGDDVAEAMSPILEAMTSQAKFLNADDKTRNLLLTSVSALGKEGQELYQQILSGTAGANQEAPALLAKGMNKLFQRLNSEHKDLTQLDEIKDLSRASLQLDSIIGKEAGIFSQMAEALGKTKSFAGRIKEINDQLAAGVSIEEEKLLLENKRQEMIGRSENVLSQLSAAMDKSKTLDEALNKFGSKKNLYGQDLPTLGVTAKDNAGIVQQTLMIGFKNLNESLKIAGKPEIEIDFKQIQKAFNEKDTKTVQGFMEQLKTGRQALATQQKTNVDELSGMQQTLREINGSIRNFAQGTISSLLNSMLGQLTIIALTLTSILFGILGFAGKLAWFAAETQNLFMGGEGIYGRYQKGLLEYIGYKNPDNPEFAKYFDKKRAIAEDKAARAMNKAAASTEKTVKMGGKNYTARATGKKLAVAPESFGFKVQKGFKGLKHIIYDIYKWNSRVGNQIAKFINNTGSKISKSIESVTKIIAKEMEKGFVNVISKSWAKSYNVMRTGAVEFGKQAEKVWKFIGPKMRQGLKAVWEIGQTDVTPMFKNIKSGIAKVPSIVSNGLKKVWELGKTDVTPMFTNAKNAVVNFGGKFKANMINGIRAVPSLARNSMTLLTKGIGGGLSSLVKIGTRAGSAFAKFLGPIGIAMIAIDGLTTAMSAGARAAKIFKKDKLEELSLNEEYAAKSSGLLMGVLNGLTFGLLGLLAGQERFDGWINSLAIFISKVPLLTIVFGTIVAALEATWGVIKGIGVGIWEVAKGIGTAIWEIGSGLWDGIAAILNPITDGLSDVFLAIGSIFSKDAKDKVSGLVDVFRKLGGVVGIVSAPFIYLGKLIGSIIGGIGKAVGWILRTVGGIIGFVIKSIFKVIEGFAIFVEPFKEVFDVIGETIGEIGNVFAELWTDISPVFTGIGSVFSDIGSIFSDVWKEISSLFGGFGGESKGFMDALKNIGWVLGKVVGFFLRFVLQPVIVALRIISGIAKIFQAIFKALRGDFSGAGKLISSALAGVWDALIYPLKSVGSLIWKYIGRAFMEGLSTLGQGIYDSSPDWLKSVFDGISSIGSLWENVIAKPIRNWGTWIAKQWDQWIMVPLGRVGLWLEKQWDEWIIKPLGRLSGWFTENFYKPIESAIQNYIVTPLTNLALAFTGLVDRIMSFISGKDKAAEDAEKSAIDTKRASTSFADKTLEKAVVAAKTESKEVSIEVIKETIKKLESQSNVQSQAIADTQKAYNESGMGWNKLNPMAWLYKGIGDTFWKEGSTITQNQMVLLKDVEQKQAAQSKIMDNLLMAKKLLREKEGKQTPKDQQVVAPSSKTIGQNITDEQLLSIKKIKSENLTQKEAFIQKYKEENQNRYRSLGPGKQQELIHRAAENAWAKEKVLNMPGATNESKILPNGMQNAKSNKVTFGPGEIMADERLVEPAKSTASSIERLTEEATEKHSIYTHDTHVEKLLLEIGKNFIFMLSPVASIVQIMSDIPSKIMNLVPSMLPKSLLSTKEDVLYKLTEYTKTNSIAQEGIPSIFNKLINSNIADIQYPMNVEPSASDEIENNYYYKQNLEKNKARTVLNTSPMVSDITTAISKEKATSENKTEIVSPELGEIAESADDQRILLAKLVELMSDVKKLLDPKTNISSSSGGRTGRTASNQVSHGPPNYNRNTVGLVSQTPAKGIVNLGQIT